MAKKGQHKRMTRERAAARRPMTPPPVGQPPQENDLLASPRVLQIKAENIKGMYADIKIEQAVVHEVELFAKPEPDDAATVIKQETTKVVHKCAMCDKTLANEKSLAQHIKRHNAYDNIYDCDQCGKSYKSAGGLHNHKISKHASEPSEIAKPYKCPHCNVRCVFKYKLKRHMLKHEEKKFRCGTCQKLFHTKYERSLHRERVHVSNKTKPCLMCTKSFSTERLLKFHLRIAHKKDKLKCIFCKISCVNNRDIGNHVRMHIQEKPFSCQICGKAFPGKIHREKHGKSHNMEQKCQVCSNLFTTEHSLKSHLEYAHQENRWRCVFCERTFGTKQRLKYHIVRKIKEKPCACRNCKESFATYCDRWIHLARQRCRDKTLKCTEMQERH